MIESLLTEAKARGYRVKAIEAEDRYKAIVWWVDLYRPGNNTRRHGYGTSLAEALSAAFEAEPTVHSTPTYDPCHVVTAALRSEAAFVRRRL